MAIEQFVQIDMFTVDFKFDVVRRKRRERVSMGEEGLSEQRNALGIESHKDRVHPIDRRTVGAQCEHAERDGRRR